MEQVVQIVLQDHQLQEVVVEVEELPALEVQEDLEVEELEEEVQHQVVMEQLTQVVEVVQVVETLLLMEVPADRESLY